jgi:hypothetical protein
MSEWVRTKPGRKMTITTAIITTHSHDNERGRDVPLLFPLLYIPPSSSSCIRLTVFHDFCRRSNSSGKLCLYYVNENKKCVYFWVPCRSGNLEYTVHWLRQCVLWSRSRLESRSDSPRLHWNDANRLLHFSVLCAVRLSMILEFNSKIATRRREDKVTTQTDERTEFPRPTRPRLTGKERRWNIQVVAGCWQSSSAIHTERDVFCLHFLIDVRSGELWTEPKERNMGPCATSVAAAGV